MTPREVLVNIEDRLLDERNRLAAEYVAMETARAGQCAAAVVATGLAPAFIMGLERFCRAADFAELESRADTLATMIGVIETAIERLPRLADLDDPAKQATAIESMTKVARAVESVSGVSDLLDDVAEFVRKTVDDATDVGLDFAALALGAFAVGVALKVALG